jgi:hypothetical protein
MNATQDQEKLAIPKKELSPWDPYRALGMAFIASWALGGIILAFNWRRLGKPHWFVPTLLFSVLVQGAALAFTLYWITVFRTVVSMPKIFLYYVPALFLGIAFGIPFALARMQNGAYKRYKKEGPGALTDYPYDILDTITYGVILWVVISVIALLAFTFLFSTK